MGRVCMCVCPHLCLHASHMCPFAHACVCCRGEQGVAVLRARPSSSTEEAITSCPNLKIQDVPISVCYWKIWR